MIGKEVSEASKAERWLSHIFLPVDDVKTREHCRKKLQDGLNKNKDNQGFLERFRDLSDLHVSLSKPFNLEFIQIEPFLEYLGARLNHIQRFALCLDTSCYHVLVNEERSAVFLCLAVKGEWALKHLQKVGSQTDSTLKHFRHEPYFQTPIYHVSLASVGIESEDEIEAIQRTCNSEERESKKRKYEATSFSFYINKKAHALDFLTSSYDSSEGEKEQGEVRGERDEIIETSEDITLFVDTLCLTIGNRRYEYRFPSVKGSAVDSKQRVFRRIDNDLSREKS